MPTLIDNLYSENAELIKYLESNREISFQTNVDNLFRKILLLSVASYFETEIRDILLDFFQEQANRSSLTINFIKSKAIERQYHTYFSWKESSANSFFALFGDEFRDFMKAEVKKDKILDESIKTFIKLGKSRNELVHGNFASYQLQSTANEIYEDYKKAISFIELLPIKLREFQDQPIQNT